MGNCCGKAKGGSGSNFQGGGRTLNAAPAKVAAAPNGGRSAAAPKVGGPGRTLGGSSTGPSEAPGEAAARAAEARITSPKPQGKLAKQLEAQKARTHNETLAQTARDNLAARNADANTEARVTSPKMQGKLAKQLEAQQALTPHEVLTQAAKDNLAARKADANTEARRYD